MKDRVAKTFSLSIDTLMLLMNLQKVKNVNLSAFADNVLKKCAKEALGLGNELIQEGESK